MEGASFHGDRIRRKVRGREMGFIIPHMRSPRKEEQHQQVPENDVTSSQSFNYHGACGGDGAGRMANELGGMLFGDEEMLKWGTLEMKEEEISFSSAFWDNSVEKGETVTSASASNGLNLNLNYQEVLDEWSNRGPLWARDYYSSRFPQCRYTGEVPEMEMEVKAEGGRGGCWSKSREASVMRYKEKRQSRLFSNRIRYQVRKLNADSRPRLKVHKP